MAKLAASVREINDIFGGSVALSGDLALVAASGADNETGLVYVYERAGTGLWVEVVKLTASDSAPGDQFGSVALSGDRALVGAEASNHAGFDSGSAYIYSFAPTGDVYDAFPLDPERSLRPLIPGSVDPGEYGFRFEGNNSHREALELQFNASGSELLLTLTGYDIDFGTEVRVLVNGTRIGYLSRTPNNGRGTSQLWIESHQQRCNKKVFRLRTACP